MYVDSPAHSHYHLLTSPQTTAWVSIELNVPLNLTYTGDQYSEAPMFLGTPEQRMNLTVNLQSTDIVAYGKDCLYCIGLDSYRPNDSQTAKVPTVF